MKFGQLKKNITRNVLFFKDHAENEARRLVPGLFWLFEKALQQEVKASSLQLNFTIFR